MAINQMSAQTVQAGRNANESPPEESAAKAAPIEKNSEEPKNAQEIISQRVREAERDRETKMARDLERAKEDLKEALKEALMMDDYRNRSIRLEIERDLDMVITKIIDRDSGDVIKQIPLSDIIDIVKDIRRGLLVNKEA